MIVVKHWKHYGKYRNSTWRGVFLFGIIPIYLQRIKVD